MAEWLRYILYCQLKFVQKLVNIWQKAHTQTDRQWQTMTQTDRQQERCIDRWWIVCRRPARWLQCERRQTTYNNSSCQLTSATSAAHTDRHTCPRSECWDSLCHSLVALSHTCTQIDKHTHTHTHTHTQTNTHLAWSSSSTQPHSDSFSGH